MAWVRSKVCVCVCVSVCVIRHTYMVHCTGKVLFCNLLKIGYILN